MSLEEEIEQEIRFALAETPAMQRAYAEGRDVKFDSPEELIQHFLRQYETTRKAILRLAREIDKLRREP
jgi:ferritin